MSSGKRRTVRVLALLTVVAVAFYAGTRHQKYRGQMQASLAPSRAPQVWPPAAPLLESQTWPFAAVPAPPALRSSRKLETALLPLLVDTVAIPPALGVRAGQGGGLTLVKDTIVLVDLHGGFFKVEAKGGRIDRLALPPLPNNADMYDRFARKPMKLEGIFDLNWGFHVHDVESRIEAGGIRLFVAYERYLQELGTTALVVSAIVLGATDFAPLGPWEDIYVGPPLVTEWYAGITGGGRMLAHGDDLYLTVGDYHQDGVFMPTPLVAQNPDSDFGKILKIDLRTKAKSIVSIGHRNPQGLIVTTNGTIYATEHGPRGGDELNVIVTGKNYGWPVTTFGTHYTTYRWPHRELQSSGQGFEPPVFAWVPSIGVSNLIESGNFDPAWDNDLLVGSLVARSLFRLRRDRDGRVVYSEPIPLGHRLRDIAALPDGTLVIWTDEARLLFLSVDRGLLATNDRRSQ